MKEGRKERRKERKEMKEGRKERRKEGKGNTKEKMRRRICWCDWYKKNTYVQKSGKIKQRHEFLLPVSLVKETGMCLALRTQRRYTCCLRFRNSVKAETETDRNPIKIRSLAQHRPLHNSIIILLLAAGRTQQPSRSAGKQNALDQFVSSAPLNLLSIDSLSTGAESFRNEWFDGEFQVNLMFPCLMESNDYNSNDGLLLFADFYHLATTTIDNR